MQLSSFGVTRSTFTLPNGLRCVVFERPGMPVNARIAFKAGGRYDPAGKEGLAHYVEHMIVAGTQKFPTKTDLATYIENYGGIFGASTQKEEMYVNAAIGDPADLDIAFNALEQMLTKSLFRDKAIANERQAVLGEIGNWEANPASKIWDVMYRLFFQETALGRSTVGTVGTVNSIQQPELLQFVREMLTAERGVVIVSGGATAEEVKNSALKHLINIPQSGRVGDASEIMINRANPIMIEAKENEQLQVRLGFRTCNLQSNDTVPLDLIATILGGGRASSLTRILRQEQGLVYSVAAGSNHMSSGGWWSVNTTAPKAKLQRVLDSTCLEFQRVYDGGITAAELEFAKNKTIKSTLRLMQTSQAWVDFHSRQALYGDAAWSLSDYLQAVADTSLKDVAGVGAKYFLPGAWYLGMVGNVTEQDFDVNY